MIEPGWNSCAAADSDLLPTRFLEGMLLLFFVFVFGIVLLANVVDLYK